MSMNSLLFKEGLFVEIKGVEPLYFTTRPGIPFQYFLMNFALVLSGCKYTTFFKTCKKNNFFFFKASGEALVRTRMQIYNLFSLPNKLKF
jgi:hypothetical protein